VADLSLVGVCSGHSGGIWCVHFSPVDQCLATASADGTVKMWALSDFSCVRVRLCCCWTLNSMHCVSVSASSNEAIELMLQCNSLQMGQNIHNFRWSNSVWHDSCGRMGTWIF